MFWPRGRVDGRLVREGALHGRRCRRGVAGVGVAKEAALSTGVLFFIVGVRVGVEAAGAAGASVCLSIVGGKRDVRDGADGGFSRRDGGFGGYRRGTGAERRCGVGRGLLLLLGDGEGAYTAYLGSCPHRVLSANLGATCRHLDANRLNGMLGIDLRDRRSLAVRCLGRAVGATGLNADNGCFAAHDGLSGKRRDDGVLAVHGRGNAAARKQARRNASAGVAAATISRGGGHGIAEVAR